MRDRHIRRRRKRSGHRSCGHGDLWNGEFEFLVTHQSWKTGRASLL
jgi:hypothetical protein